MEPPEAEPKAHLLLTMLDGEDVSIPVSTSPFTIGRAKTCDYVIDNRIVSSIHCKLHHDEEHGSFFLEDTSTNGMLINKTVRTVKGKKFPLNDGDVVFLIYRKLTKNQKDVISFRFEEVKKMDEETNVLDKTIPYEEEEFTEEYNYGNDEDTSLQEAEKKRKRDDDEVPPIQEAKKVHLTPEVAPPVSSAAVSSSDDQKEGIEMPKMTEDKVPPDGAPSQERDKGVGEGPLTAEKTGKETGVEGEESQDEMMETLVCSICQDILHDCVSLQPCMHTFCASCYSQWMIKSSRCPTCRKVVKRVCKNHIVNNLVEAYLKVHPNKKRDAEEIAEMDAKNKITSDMLIPPRPTSDDEDYDYDDDDDDDEGSHSDDSFRYHNRSEEVEYQPQISGGLAFWGLDPNIFGGNWPSHPIMTCKACPGSKTTTPSSNTGTQPGASSTTAPTSTAQPSTSGEASPVGATGTSGQNFRIATGNVRVPLPTPPSYICPPQASHLMCRCCQERFPDRRAEPSQNNIPPVSCSMCNMFYCHMYWGCTKNADCYGCLSKFKDMNFGDKCTDLLILGNLQESSIFKKYLQQKNLTWKSILDESLEKLEQGEFQSLLASLNSITKESIICYPCGLKVFKDLAYLYREKIPRDQLPAEASSRPDCYWGRNCRTQFNKPVHAARFNHVCNQTRF